MKVLEFNPIKVVYFRKICLTRIQYTVWDGVGKIHIRIAISHVQISKGLALDSGK